MSRDQAVGVVLALSSICAIIVYAWLVFFTQWAFLVLKLTGFAAIAGVFGVLAWIGYTLAATPPPKPIEEIEKELEEELKKLEEEVKEEPRKEEEGEKKEEEERSD